MVRKNLAKGWSPRDAPGLRVFSVSMPIAEFNKLRDVALAEDRSVSNMVRILMKRGMKAEKQ